MRKINKTILWTMLLSIVLGAVIVLAGQWTLHKTSSTEFCLSCHTMQAPMRNIPVRFTFRIRKGFVQSARIVISRKAALDYLVAKLRASKDVYHQFITKNRYPGKI